MDIQVQLPILLFREPGRDASTSPIVRATKRQMADESVRAKYSNHPTNRDLNIWKGRQKNRLVKDGAGGRAEKIQVVLNFERVAYEISNPRMLCREVATTSGKRVR